jgi:hypothetical protein
MESTDVASSHQPIQLVLQPLLFTLLVVRASHDEPAGLSVNLQDLRWYSQSLLAIPGLSA